MKTIKQVAELTGISARTLRYYDEIGLLKPTALSEAGYRLYDDKALDILQQILFFKEFEIPLKNIIEIMQNPDFDKRNILQKQRNILQLERTRLDGLIHLADDLLKGDYSMDFEIFNRDEIETMYQTMMTNMPLSQKSVIENQYEGLSQFKKIFIQNAATNRSQQNFKKIVQWYGDTDSNTLHSTDILNAYQKRFDEIYAKLAAAHEQDIHSFDVKKIIGEMDFVSKQLYQMDDVTEFMLELADMYQKDTELISYYDNLYGLGTAHFFSEAIKSFYLD